MNFFVVVGIVDKTLFQVWLGKTKKWENLWNAGWFGCKKKKKCEDYLSLS